MGLSLKGVQNIFGHARSAIGMTVPMMVIIFAMGFLIGFISPDSESLFYMSPDGILYAAAAAGTAVFVIGTIYSVAVAEKKWQREND